MSGRYVLGKRLAVGGMAEIFAARVKGAGGFEKDVVVKRILPAFAGDVTFRERFYQEARLAALLTHPNIVQTYELVEQDGETLLAMEAVNGADIATLLRVARDAGKGMPASCALHVAACIADALAYAHDKKGPDGAPLHLVHRDVTPSNVLVSSDGVPKLIDFGIAKAASGSAPQTQAGLVLGKAWYLSPEQCLGRPVDGKSDVFALGVVLFQMLAGRVPFGGRNGIAAMDKIAKGARPALSSLVTVPKVVEQVVDAALIVDKELRPSAKVWRAQIERALSAVDPERRARDELVELIQRAHMRPAGGPAPVEGVAASAPTLLLMDLSAASADAGGHASDADDDDAPASPDTRDTGDVVAANAANAAHGANAANAANAANGASGASDANALHGADGALMSDVKPAATTVDARPPDAVQRARAAHARSANSRGLVAAGFVAVGGAIGAVALVVWLRGDSDAREAKDAPPVVPIAMELRSRDAPPVDEDAPDDGAALDDDDDDGDVVEASDGGAPTRAVKTKRNKRKRGTRTTKSAQVTTEQTDKGAKDGKGGNVDKGASANGGNQKIEGKGVITFHAEPWAQVWLGGKSLGMTWTGSIDVPAGKHSLYLKNPVSGHEKTIVVDVKPGSRQSMYVTLEKRAPPKP